ncbi:hypothetical protein H696_05823 [Fonticula alba]|uniref:Exportin-1 n=1 Tax=Fonticula alba TaxID=691883 RepID=A0A058Z0C9_FONAL|nr:hypothetical protein H696_05823 [Fonticula alba]KCV67715.1 hypothetical protein H696_05823 [Fonticula alba]|eukprot:XP_009497899.1 hypothetical protein H696_05823 [Fonticula alba]
MEGGPLNVYNLDVSALDQIVKSFHNGTDVMNAQALLVQFQDHPESWTCVDKILENSTFVPTKFLALQIMDKLVQTRWNLIPREQCEGIRNFLVTHAISLARDEAFMSANASYMHKLDLVIVQIIKQDWPHRWESLIPDLVGSSKTSESICENNMIILKLLSEEIFDYSEEQIVSKRVDELKNELANQFAPIFSLCMFILTSASKPSLVLVALETLLRFLGWIPLGYIFETNLIPFLTEKFFVVPQSRNVTLKCLTEIASLKLQQGQGATFVPMIVRLFDSVMEKLPAYLSVETDLASTYNNRSGSDQIFIQDLANFFVGLFKEHLSVLESHNPDRLLTAHMYLINISNIDDREVFKSCLDYWAVLVEQLYREPSMAPSPLLITSSPGPTPRQQFYQQILSHLRVVMINRMVKPEEVLIVEEEGEIIREFQKDTDTIALYKAMQVVLTHLTHLDSEDMEFIMREKLMRLMSNAEWSWSAINKLCWSIGSISGAMSEPEEKRFLVVVIKELLDLVDLKRGTDNKAVVASNIMYIVGQYPRFLRQHWKFLKTVVNKLFEFMHERHEGVPDMACDTFIKIASSCRNLFVVAHVNEPGPFINTIIDSLPATISDLQPQQVQTFYEAVGIMISAATSTEQAHALIHKLMALPNQGWSELLSKIAGDISLLENPTMYKTLANILKTNVSVCSSVGQAFIVHIAHIFRDMMELYPICSQLINNRLQTGGPNEPRTPLVRGLRLIKREILKLFITFFPHCAGDPETVATSFVPDLLKVTMIDYQNTQPEVRDAEVLLLCASMVDHLKGEVIGKVHPILDAVFECTLSMISKDFQEYPDHRTGFYRLLRAINRHCFEALFTLGQAQFKLFIDSVVWGIKHTMRDIAEMALHTLQEMLEQFRRKLLAQPGQVTGFYQQYYVSLMQDVFVVLTDSDHKAGFKLQTSILKDMFDIVIDGLMPAQLFDPKAFPDNPNMTNVAFLNHYVSDLLARAFPQVTPAQVKHFVKGLLQKNDPLAFKVLVRDFLISLKQFAGQDNQELYVVDEPAADASIAN